MSILSRFDPRVTQKLTALFSYSLQTNHNNLSANKGFAWSLYQQEQISNAIYHWKISGLSDLEMIKLGDLAKRKGETNIAKIGYQIAAEMAPESGDAWFELGALALEEDQFDEALTNFKRTIGGSLHFVRSSDLLFYLGETYYKKAGQQGSAEALAAYNNAILLANFSSETIKAETFYKRGITKRKLGYPPEQSIPDFQKAIQITPTHSWAHIMLGEAYFEIDKNLIRAEPEMIAAIRLNPNDKWTYRYLGNLYLRVGKSKEAIKQFERVLEIDPDDSQVRNLLMQLKTP